MNDTILLAQTATQFEEQLTLALKSLREGDLLALGASPMAYMSLVEECFLTGEPVTADGRGRILRSLLRWGVERLRPEGEPSWVKLAWRNYNILFHFYLEGSRASHLAEAMAIAEQTLYQLRAQAISALSNVMRNEMTVPENRVSRQNVVNSDRYARYNESGQQLLRLAAVFPGAVPTRLLFALAARLGNTQPLSDAQPLLMDHLLSSDVQGSEFVIHPQMRPLLRTLLTPAERQIAHHVAADHYAEQHNFLEAAQQWRAGDQPQRAAQTLIEHRRDIIDNLQVEELAALLASFRASDIPPGLWARLKILAGEIAEFTHNSEIALAEYQQALAAPDLHTKALAYYRRAKAFEQTNSDESLAHYSRAAQLLDRAATANREDADHLTLLSNVYIDRAWLQMQVRGDLARAEEDLQRARSLLESAPHLYDRPVWCDLYNALGEFYYRSGKPELAVEHGWQAWLAANEARDLERMSKTAHNLGLLYMNNLRQYDRALEYLHKSEELARQTGNRQMEGVSAMSIGACHYWLGDLRAALEQYRSAAAIFEECSNRTLLARTFFGLAEAHAELEEADHARRFYQQGLLLATELGDQEALRDFDALTQQHSYLQAVESRHSDGLLARQQKAVDFALQQGQITNRQYQELSGLSQKQSVRDLNELVEAKLLVRQGKGRAISYRSV